MKLFIALLVIAGSANAVSITFNNNTGQKLKNITNNQEIAAGQHKVSFNLGGNQTNLLALASDPNTYISASTSEIQVYNKQAKTYSHNVLGAPYAGEWNITLDNNNDLSITQHNNKDLSITQPRRYIIFYNKTGEQLQDSTRNNQTIGDNERQYFEINDNQTNLLALASDPNTYISASTSEIQVYNPDKRQPDKRQSLSQQGKFAGAWDIIHDKYGLSIKAQ